MRPEIWNVSRVLCLAALAAVGVAAQSPQRPVFRSDVNFITVDAYPLVDGRVVAGLTIDDFEVREDGRVQKVQSFEYVRANERLTTGVRQDPGTQQRMLDELQDPRARAFVAYLDVDHVGIAGAYYGRQPIVELFQRIMAPGDLFAVATSKNHPRDLTFGRQTDVVEEQLRRHWTWRDPDVTVLDAEELTLTSCFPFEEAVVSEMIARRRQDQLLGSLEGTVEYLGEMREGRKTLFLFSGGWKWFEPNRDLLKPLNDPTRAPSKGPAVGPTPRMTPPGSASEPAGNLGLRTSLAEGGKAACEQELIRLANMNSPQRFRELMRSATLNNVVVYPVDPTGLGTSMTPPEGRRSDRLLELASNTGGTAVTNRNDLVQGVIDVSREFEAYYLLGYASDNTKADGTLRRIDVKVTKPGIEVKARRGYRALSKAEAESKAVAMAMPVSIDAERAELDAALDVLAGIRVGDEGGFDARRYLRASLAPHLGAPVVSRATPSPRSPIVAVKAPSFRRTERLHVEWPLMQAVENRTARVVGRDGNPVGVQVALTERVGTPRVLIADVVLGPLAAGDYALELTITAGGEPRRALLAFRVVP
jgi:VWFA-related protein